jgi:hypothetical protein
MANTPGYVLNFVNNFTKRFISSLEIIVTGDASETNPILLTIANEAITNEKIATDADIALTKLENVAAGTDGLSAGTLQATLQALATRIQALENV